MSEWQPIETAPTDGREILVTDGLNRAVVRYVDYFLPEYRWRLTVGDDEFYIEATHWMPLPEPSSPAEPQQQGGGGE